MQNIQKIPLRESGSKNYCSKISSEAGTKKQINEKHQQPLLNFYARMITNIFWLSNGYGGYPSPRFSNKHQKKSISLLKIHKPTKGFCIVLPTEDRVNKAYLAQRWIVYSVHTAPQRLLRARHHPTTQHKTAFKRH